MSVGGQPNNTNAIKNRPIKEAFQRALEINKPAEQRVALDSLVKVVIAKALEGDMPAAKEIFDRLEGKAIQQTEVSGLDGGAIVATIERVIKDPKNVSP